MYHRFPPPLANTARRFGMSNGMSSATASLKEDPDPLPASRERERIDDEPVHDEQHQGPAALLACVVAVYLCWATHDYLQERVFKFPGFRFGFFMAFVLQLASFVLALLQRLVTGLFADPAPELRQSRQRQQSRELMRVDEERSMLEEEQEAVGASASATQLRLFGWYLLLSALIATANGTSSVSQPVVATLPAEPVAHTSNMVLLSHVRVRWVSLEPGTSSAALNYVNMQMKLVVKNAKIVTVMPAPPPDPRPSPPSPSPLAPPPSPL